MRSWTWWCCAGLALACDTSSSSRRAAPLDGLILHQSGDDEAPSLRHVRPDGSEDRALFTQTERAYAYAEHPEQDRVLLVVTHEGVDQIALGEPTSDRVTVLAPGAELSWLPEFSPDGRFILFESARASFRDLYRYDLGAQKLDRLTDNPEGNFDGRYSPDGRHIVFASSRHMQLDLFLMNADGSGQRRLTQHLGDSVKPAWSFDGRSIAFISGRDGQDDLFLIRPDGTGMRKLSTGLEPGSQVTSFQFHPAAPRLVFSARSQAAHRIYVVDVGGDAPRALSSATARDSEPVWSPRGDGLAFTVTDGERSDIWIMNPDGGARRRVTQPSGPGGWRPRWIGEKGSRGHDALTRVPQPGIGNHHVRLRAGRETGAQSRHGI